jgi:hypothetical protein
MTVTRGVDLKSRRTQLVLLAVVVLASVVLAIVVVARSQTSGARAKASLVALTPVLPNLDLHVPVMVSHPSCDYDPPCTSATTTWSPLVGSPTFAELDQALTTWAKHNHLRNPFPVRQWDCSKDSGLSGNSAGCATGFVGPHGNQVVNVALTFTGQSSAMFDSVKTYSDGQSNALSVLGSNPLASLSVQVVGNNK